MWDILTERCLELIMSIKSQLGGDLKAFQKTAPAWCYAPFEPEGILSLISAILSTIIGLHYGHVLIHFQLYTLSYVCVTSGAATLAFSAFYVMGDLNDTLGQEFGEEFNFYVLVRLWEHS
ncbi:uncharacterized protein LOC123918501 isoform X2 [Trifolium pratense]|uniref:uncharacterized protein LOC123918501 isoform X2 n=1 Tax=Trifolium pratense TaxID=57577 RepID=UPI001E694C05|nr:uncharacterized protein LOC123918501 isoform X2 [Trifolium pratense]XP_045826523.1 uncharacterized protein LOC123918501 isoform X2 [Trifolium pratense]